MTGEELTQALDKVQAPKETRNVLDLIGIMAPEIQKSLQSEAGAEMMIRHYYNAIRYDPLLLQCTPESLIASLLLSAQVRLEPGPLGHVYLVPFRNSRKNAHEVVWMLGYTGIIELGRRGGASGLRASVVWDCDEFVPPWENEKGQHWTLTPGPLAERSERVGVLVTWKDGSERQALFMPPERVDVAVKASRNPKAGELRQEDWYWRKTAVRFARPWLPLTTDGGAAAFATASHADGAVAASVDLSDGLAVPMLDGGDDA